MRRFVVLIIMLIVPLQFAWAAATGVHAHERKDVATAGFHTHDRDHHESAHPDLDASGDTSNKDHNEDGHHGHSHPVFSPILLESGLTLNMALASGPILHPPAAFFSRIPPLFDRPPLARA